MKQIIFLLVLFSSVCSNAQNKFRPGFFIDNSGTRIECFIKAIDPSQNPTSFQYKLNETENELTLNSIDILEIQVFDRFKYIRRTVDLDRSKTTSDISSLDENRKPNFKKETLLLKVIVEGAASLYKFKEGNVLKYFLQVGDTEITQLIYKKFQLANGIGMNIKNSCSAV